MMKSRRFSTMLAIVAIAVLSSTSLAQPPGDGEGRRGRDGGGRGFGPPGGGGRGFGPPGGGRGGPPIEALMRALPVLAALDADQDGALSKSEIENAAAALKKLDKNNDGQLTAEEMRPDPEAMRGRGFGPPGGGRGPGGREGGRGFGGPPGGGGRGPDGDPSATVERYMQYDKNKDGKLAKDELSGRMQGILARADANEDGFATREELQAMATRGAGRGGRDRGGEGGGRPGGERPRRPEIE